MMMNGHAKKDVAVLSEAEMIEAEVDRLMEAEVARRRSALRLEVADRMRREAFVKHMDEIKRRGDEVDAAHAAFDADPQRQVELEASRKAMVEKRAAADARWAEQEARRMDEKGRNGFPRGTLRGTGAEGFTKR
jgi:hypothetical protein